MEKYLPDEKGAVGQDSEHSRIIKLPLSLINRKATLDKQLQVIMLVWLAAL